MSMVSVKSFGAVGDGVNDDTISVQAAIDYVKALPGTELFFPRGLYLITQSLNLTYDGGPAGLSSGYYGFSIVGEERFNTVLIGHTNGTPLLDMTGKPQMTFRDIGFGNFDQSGPRSSCALLLARNTTNSLGGGHCFDRVTFRGYFGKTLVQCASSEVNRWNMCDFDMWGDDGSCMELTEQILTGINSEYIDLSNHVFNGGNTFTSFAACSWLNNVGQVTGPCLVVEGSENVTLSACYTRNTDGPAISIVGDNALLHMQNHRDESEGSWMIEAQAGSSMRALDFSGRGSRGIYGHDGSSFINSRIDPSFLATTFDRSVDVYDFVDSYLGYVTLGVRVRNNARGSVFGGFQLEAELNMPTEIGRAPREVRIDRGNFVREYRRDLENLDSTFAGDVKAKTITAGIKRTDAQSGDGRA